jgi:perosamine synthetase
MTDLGYNYRMTDFQCALGISQLSKLPNFLKRRKEIAALHDEALANIPGIKPLGLRLDLMPTPHSMLSTSHAMRHAPNAVRSTHAYHLYVIKIDFKKLDMDRTAFFTNLRKRGIGVNVYYIPVYMHPFYKKRFNSSRGLCPIAEEAYEQIISLPMFPGMQDEDIEKVIEAMKKTGM